MLLSLSFDINAQAKMLEQFFFFLLLLSRVLFPRSTPIWSLVVVSDVCENV